MIGADAFPSCLMDRPDTVSYTHLDVYKRPVYRDGQFPMIFPVCHIVKGLEQVAVDHAHQIIETGIRIRDTAKQRHLFLPDAVKIQFIGTGQIGDLF